MRFAYDIVNKFKVDIIVVIIAFIIFIQFEKLHFNQIITENREQAGIQLALVQSKVSALINNDLEKGEQLVIQLNENPNWSQADYVLFVEELIKDQREISHIAVAQDYIIDYIAPVAGNEKALGVDYREIPDQLNAINKVIDSGHTVITNLVNLVQGGTAIIARVPYVISQTAQGTRWGLIAIVLKTDVLLSSVQEIHDDERYYLSIKSLDKSSGDLVQIFGLEDVYNNTPLTSTLPLEGNEWEFAISLNNDFIYASYSLLFWTIRFVFFIVVLLILFSSHTLRQKKVIIKALQNEVKVRKKTEVKFKKAKESAERANRIKSHFLANMSHDLRTPLNAIKGFSEIMKQKTFGPLGNENYDEYPDIIFSSSNYLLNLINDILDISKIEAGEFELNLSHLNVTNLINESVELLTPLTMNKSIQIILEDQKTNAYLFADKRALQQVFVNILSNSIKFTPKGGTITVSQEVNDNSVIIKVEDTGIGIDEKVLKKITEPFIQSSSNPNVSHEGTGLGLAIVKSLVLLHKGSLVIESELGKGTSVTITLPNNLIPAQA